MPDSVGDEELLYRSASPERGHSFIDETGKKRLSSMAFADKEKQVSVDRAILCNSNPAYTKKSDKDGVVGLIAKEVRAIKSVVQNGANGKPIQFHAIDVIPDPVQDHENLPDNPAHALIVPTPDYANDGVFRKLRESLVRIAESRGWLVEPD